MAERIALGAVERRWLAPLGRAHVRREHLELLLVEHIDYARRRLGSELRLQVPRPRHHVGGLVPQGPHVREPKRCSPLVDEILTRRAVIFMRA
jgi:hypothetical protein